MKVPYEFNGKPLTPEQQIFWLTEPPIRDFFTDLTDWLESDSLEWDAVERGDAWRD